MKENALWFVNAVFYGLDVETYYDSNNDGVGDFQGLIQKLDHLQELGVNAIWILPFYPSPNKDNGYDVTNYYDIDERLGSLDDFTEFIKKANARDIRIIMDLVIHHTSDQHPWFLAAQKNSNSRYHDYYVWADEIPETEQKENIFPDKEEEVWSYSKQAGKYYYHRFYSFQPDLNIANPQVRDEIKKVMYFWLTYGVSGFRIDAATHLFERKGIEGTEVKDKAAVMEEFNQFVKKRNPEAILVAESDVRPDRYNFYFGEGNRMDMLFNFLLNNYLFLSLATKQAGPLEKILKSQAHPSTGASWLNFIRNLDELDLERLNKEDRQTVFEQFAPEEKMQIYGRGIRRRLAPMLKGDTDRLKMVWSLLFSFPGSPLIIYGDEIGMGENLLLDGRESVRTPMQWSDEENAGFSRSSAKKLIQPVISEGQFSYRHVNVSEQSKARGTLLESIKEVILARKEHRIFGITSCTVLDVDQGGVIALSYEGDNENLLTIHNLTEAKKHVTLDKGVGDTQPLIENQSSLSSSNTFDLGGYGYGWYIF